MNGSIFSAAFFAICWMASANAGDLVFKTIDEETHRPLSGKEPAKAVVLIFTATDCPVANYFQPTIRRIAKRYEGKGVRFFQVYPDRDTDAESAKKHAKEYEITTAQVLDPEQKLAGEAGAKKTPEAVVYNAAGEVVYRGRIDDTYAALGKKRARPTTADLKATLDAILGGKNPALKEVEAVGCFIFFEEHPPE